MITEKKPDVNPREGVKRNILWQHYLRQIEGHTKTPIEQIDEAKANLETINPLPTGEIPDITVCIPVALFGENINSLELAVRKVIQANQNTRPNIIVWINYFPDRYTDDRPSNEQISEKYDNMKKVLGIIAGSQTSITFKLDAIPGIFSMNQVRQNMMDGVVGLAQEKNYPLNHPISWIDADATDIEPGYFDHIARETSESDAYTLYAPTINYSTGWYSGEIEDADPNTRLFVVHEALRRAIAEKRGNSLKNNRYLEESGLAFSLETWLASGGLGLGETVGQSFSLKRRLGLDSPKSLSTIATISSDNDIITEIIEKAKSYRVEAVPYVLESSGRWTYRNMQELGASALTSRSLDPDYELFTARDAGNGTQVANPWPVIREIRRAIENHLVSTADGRELFKLAKRLLHDRDKFSKKS